MSLLSIATGPNHRSEKDEERLCDDFIARRGVRTNVVRFSQPRNTMQTLGIPDRRYFTAGLAFWWDVKSETGKLSAEQVAFMQREEDYGNLAGCGTLDDLVAFVNVLVSYPANLRVQAGIQLARELREKYTRKAKKANRGKV